MNDPLRSSPSLSLLHGMSGTNAILRISQYIYIPYNIMFLPLFSILQLYSLQRMLFLAHFQWQDKLL